MPDDHLRLLGAWAISEIADPTVLPDLVEAVQDVHPEVRAKVARAFARLPAPASVEALRILAHEPIWFVRLCALHSLRELGAPEGGEIALAALADEVREVRFRAAYALRKIQGMKTEIVVNVLRTGSRLSFFSLIFEWDRAGFLDSIARDLSNPDGVRAHTSREFIRVLIAAGVTSTLEPVEWPGDCPRSFWTLPKSRREILGVVLMPVLFLLGWVNDSAFVLFTALAFFAGALFSLTAA